MEEISVFVAFRRGVAHVLPEFATKLIRALGAEPACEFDFTPAHMIALHRRGSAPVLGGQGVKASRKLDMYEYELSGGHRQPKRSWKRYRNTRWRQIAMAQA